MMADTRRRAFLHLLTSMVALMALMTGRAGAEVSPKAQAALLEPPTVNGQPVRVSVALWILNIPAIDEVAQRVDMVGYLIADWKDPRLVYTPHGDDDTWRVYQPGEIWMPRFQFPNAVTPHTRYDGELSARPDGSVRYLERWSVSLSSRFYLRRFPFDSQTLRLSVQPFLANASRELLAGRPEMTGIEQGASDALAQWQVGAIDFASRRVRLDNGKRYISQLDFDIAIRRRSAFYIWKVFLPLLLMVCLSWTVFWVDPMDLSSQVTISVTTILTIIAFGFSIAASLPRVPYLTYVDAFFLTCYIFVFLSIVELVAVHFHHRRERGARALRIRVFARKGLPAAFI